MESITRVLSFPCEIGDSSQHDGGPGSNPPSLLNRVVESEGVEVDLTIGNAIVSEDSNPKVR